ncbi:MAG TPA: class I SAM-dependent methyltransferase [Candidatus Pacearchaeota archaeon]|nr:class I SAM-dependent methyltransferase [Candidatus Pacearchaeota archaeon]HQM24758.1 class I SAM-dependent methyltransferase [Candidatus Pacearchaeota archaeon]
MNSEFLNPKEVLQTIPLKQDMVACDLGCGSGGWAIPLAKTLNKGIVYAVDILEEALSALGGKVEIEKLVNIKPILSDAEKGVKIGDSTIDFVLLSNILFENDNKEFIIKETKRLLKKDGMALIVDWKEDSPIGLKDKKFSFEGIRTIINSMGFKIEREFDAGKYHWAILIKKI